MDMQIRSTRRQRDRYHSSGGREAGVRRETTVVVHGPGSFSRKDKRITQHFIYGVFLISIWFCVFGSDDIWKGIAVNAEGPILPTTLSSSSLSSSLSKARIVVPSSRQEEWNIGDSDDFKSIEESLSLDASVDDRHNPMAFLSRQEYGSEDAVELPIDGVSAIPPPPKSNFKKTGTTIAGCVLPGVNGDGPYVVLAADTRATANTLVADKRCDKIHKLASNCRCCGAGTSADLDKTTRQVLYQMALRELHKTNIGNGEMEDGRTELLYPEHDDDNAEPLLWMRPVSIEVLCGIFQDMLFRNGGQLGANLIVGGVWKNKAYLRAIHPHGSTDINLPFTALGSGGLAAMAVLEEGYKPSLTLEEGVDLVQRAILSGVRNDLGSGSQVDLCVIGPDGNCQQTRAVIPEEKLLPDGKAKNGDMSVRTNRLLELLGSDGKVKDEKEESQEDGKTRNSGVNGFGNQPFAIENTRQRMISVETDRAKQKAVWDEVLGI